MNHVNVLRQTLKPHLQWHGARLSFLALFLIALFRVKTVNLTQLSIGFLGNAKTKSNYKRLQRFLRYFDLDYYALAKLVITMMEIPEPWVLSIGDKLRVGFICQVFFVIFSKLFYLLLLLMFVAKATIYIRRQLFKFRFISVGDRF